MGCGCKDRRRNEEAVKLQQQARIKMTENGTVPNPPEPVQFPNPPMLIDPSELINKLNEIHHTD